MFKVVEGQHSTCIFHSTSYQIMLRPALERMLLCSSMWMRKQAPGRGTCPRPQSQQVAWAGVQLPLAPVSKH